MEGKVLKANIGELEEEVRAGDSRMMRKELTGVVKVSRGGGGSWRVFKIVGKRICPRIN